MHANRRQRRRPTLKRSCLRRSDLFGPPACVVKFDTIWAGRAGALRVARECSQKPSQYAVRVSLSTRFDIKRRRNRKRNVDDLRARGLSLIFFGETLRSFYTTRVCATTTKTTKHNWNCVRVPVSCRVRARREIAIFSTLACPECWRFKPGNRYTARPVERRVSHYGLSDLGTAARR